MNTGMICAFCMNFILGFRSNIVLFCSKLQLECYLTFYSYILYTRYDYRAGFWGVMGQPCLGMIPVRELILDLVCYHTLVIFLIKAFNLVSLLQPYIAEFNYPMPKNCAGGNTGVFINGRELHQKDLDLLVGRGLPDSPDRSYRVEISGKVSDEVSGEELYCLGKLAPT